MLKSTCIQEHLNCETQLEYSHVVGTGRSSYAITNCSAQRSVGQPFRLSQIDRFPQMQEDHPHPCIWHKASADTEVEFQSRESVRTQPMIGTNRVAMTNTRESPAASCDTSVAASALCTPPQWLTHQPHHMQSIVSSLPSNLHDYEPHYLKPQSDMAARVSVHIHNLCTDCSCDAIGMLCLPTLCARDFERLSTPCARDFERNCRTTHGGEARRMPCK